ncbi:uncharacterized protein CTHT_0021190 [Thermochaetoides thermophila DSM 1495]|uniref:WW domain-containing protein n=1 Tax=Chaetomium thermophilum (strain DSM 1495 / CBS 144.50 / IMI 039719) TaxID=759272 RepID=G0S8B9_CHATD|nr:hypothetical protein CTHT_0021190 [Thermochaetoides thermophila DSM 1495]EGS20294.1 hypothetical protein CTHT_0021190 [Thermochaetoides thermophila DSM 1495]
MVKSTYQPSSSALPPLPPGWTEHIAPTGHKYYYNAETKESTYKRPGVTPTPPPPPPAAVPAAPVAVPGALPTAMPAAVPAIGPAAVPVSGYVPPLSTLNLSDPAVANAFMAQYRAQSQPQQLFGGAKPVEKPQPKPRPQPKDKPKSKVAIPGCEPWVLVYTKYGRRFVYNPVKNASYWRIPEKLMPAILEMDKERIRKKAEGDQEGGKKEEEEEKEKETSRAPEDSKQSEKRKESEAPSEQPPQRDYDSSEYEEVEVTDDEDEAADQQDQSGPPEFTEADIATQLALMNAEYGEQGDYEAGEEGQWEEGDEGLPLSEEDARALFKDLLNDFHINPYSPWEKLMEEGKIFDDARYTVLPTTKARKEVWEEWSREKIAQLKEQRAKQEKQDPRIAFLAFLQEKATPKLYWPEFKRKYRKEGPMRDTSLSDKEREKFYREHINRLKMPQSQLKTDLKKLLQSVPLSQLNNQTLSSHLPSQVLADIRYISLPPEVRDPLIEAYIKELGPPPEASENAEDEAARQAREERRKRHEKALQERERAVAEEKKRQERKLQIERERLREEERELERAMHVSKKGLQTQLLGDQMVKEDREKMETD